MKSEIVEATFAIKCVGAALSGLGGEGGRGAVGEEDFFFAEEAFGDDAAAEAIFDQAIGMDDGLRGFGVLHAHDVVEPGFLTHGVDVDFLAIKLVDQGFGAFVVGAGEAAGMVFLAFDALGDQRSVDPAHGRAVAFHADEKGIHIADQVVDMLIELRADVAGVGGKQEAMAIGFNAPGGFGLNVEVAVLAHKRQSHDGAASERDLFHLGKFNHILKAALLKQQAKRRVLESAATVARNHDIANARAELQECFKKNVVLVIVGDQNVIDYRRQVLVGVARDVVFVGVAEHRVHQNADTGGFHQDAGVTEVTPARAGAVVFWIRLGSLRRRRRLEADSLRAFYFKSFLNFREGGGSVFEAEQEVIFFAGEGEIELYSVAFGEAGSAEHERAIVLGNF